MKQEFEQLYQSLETNLQEIAKSSPRVIALKDSIEVIKKMTKEITHPSKLKFKTRNEEIEFFRYLWPKIYGKLFLYHKLRKFESLRNNLPLEYHAKLIQDEKRSIAQFFHTHRFFSVLYQNDLPVIASSFTRQCSINDDFEDLAHVIDSKKCTRASYLAARCLSNWEYKRFLDNELPNTPNFDENNIMSEGDYTWELSDADFVEWLYGLHELKAIKYKGLPADISRLQKWAEWCLGIKIVNIYDRFKALRSRKKDRIPFTKRTGDLLERRMDQADGKYD